MDIPLKENNMNRLKFKHFLAYGCLAFTMVLPSTGFACEENGISDEILIEKANQGDAVSQNKLGLYFEKGNCGFEQDYYSAASWYQKAAIQGNAYAQFNLGFLYAYGRGVEQDYSQALYWYQKAADQGMPWLSST